MPRTLRDSARRLRRPLRWLLLTAAALYVAYLLLVNALLFSGGLAWLLHELAPVVRLEAGRSFSLWPFRVEIRDLRLSVMDGSIHLDLEVPRGSVQIRPDQLLRSTFQTSHLEGSGLVLRLRPKYEQLDERRRRALPDLPDTYDPIIEKETRAEDLWGHALHGLDVEFEELWISEFRHLGPAQVRGGFEFRPKRSLAIDESQVRLSGELRFGKERTIASPMTLSIQTRVPTTQLDQSPPWKEIDLKVGFDARVTDGGFLGAFIGTSGGPRLEQGVCDAKLDVTLEGDELQARVHTDWERAWISTGALQTRFADAIVSGRWRGSASQLPAGTLEDGVADVAVASFDHEDFRVEGWSFRIDLPKLTVEGSPPGARGPFFAAAKDARPVARMLGIMKLPGPLDDFLTLPDLGVVGRLHVTRGAQELHIDRARSDTIDVQGRWVRLDEASYAAVLLTASPLSIGVFTGPDDSGVNLTAGEDWLEEELRKLPEVP